MRWQAHAGICVGMFSCTLALWMMDEDFVMRTISLLAKALRPS